jgi:hypothetical protein
MSKDKKKFIASLQYLFILSTNIEFCYLKWTQFQNKYVHSFGFIGLIILNVIRWLTIIMNIFLLYPFSFKVVDFLRLFAIREGTVPNRGKSGYIDPVGQPAWQESSKVKSQSCDFRFIFDEKWRSTLRLKYVGLQ